MLRYIEINDIPSEGYRIDEQIESSLIDIGNEYEITKPICFAVTVEKVKTDVIVKGAVEFSIKQICGLCLESFVLRVKTPFKIEFKPSYLEPDEEERELGKEDLDVIYLRGSVIDLFDVIREQIFLAVPIKPVCKPECLGLCHQCGSNLNIEKCNCSDEKIDPRFSVLTGLKVKN
ncbi:MAG: hypothetical protein A2W05_06660 [Candidatus Schekmanbacteria bacterium RBG_16_38_10]|uniref:DUF177 domain-containing protein n=1 Tax=Candidatus Schekmanbacteria bacterium RBG_16_38_10 TaxID=1817879 RepID=A0A1F7RTF8_9BACT|nr:MAG: hypothetical protein A2W05_06660 [Candidatus Schekmanbacteria bacterium RBG_16_38_10]